MRVLSQVLRSKFGLKADVCFYFICNDTKMGLGSSGIEMEGVAPGREVDWPCYATHDMMFASCLWRAREQHIDVQGKLRRRLKSGDTRNASYGT
jgi:hypothetical protein